MTIASYEILLLLSLVRSPKTSSVLTAAMTEPPQSEIVIIIESIGSLERAARREIE